MLINFYAFKIQLIIPWKIQPPFFYDARVQLPSAELRLESRYFLPVERTTKFRHILRISVAAEPCVDKHSVTPTLKCAPNYSTNSPLDKFWIQAARFRHEIMLFHAKLCMIANTTQPSPLKILNPAEIQDFPKKCIVINILYKGHFHYFF